MTENTTFEKQRAFDWDGLIRDFEERWKKYSKEERIQFDERAKLAYEGGFNERDEANVLVLMSFRDTPIKDIYSREDYATFATTGNPAMPSEDFISIMAFAARMQAAFIRMRNRSPELYRRMLQSYGMSYCSKWEREPNRDDSAGLPSTKSID